MISKIKEKRFLVLNFGLFGFIFWHLAKEMLQVKPDGWYVGQVNQYGDLVFHLSLINRFIVTNKLLPDSPIYAGDKLNYPIFADLITSLVAKVAGVDFALFITTFLGGLILLSVCRIFIKVFVKNEKTIFITFLIFLVNGGFGFIYFFQDYFTSGQNFSNFIFNMPREYTDIKEKGYWWINTYLAYFLPQRGFLFAFPITLVVLMLLYFGSKTKKAKLFLFAGLLSGVLPLVQAHSLFFLLIVSFFYAPVAFIRSKEKRITFQNWAIFSVVTALLAYPLIQAITSAQSATKFIRFDPGWTSEENIFWFYLKNMGLFLPLLGIALVNLYKKSKKLFQLYLPFLFVFIISNIFVFQPWEFDNSKLMLYWYFASSIVVAIFLQEFFLSQDLPRKFVGIVIIILLTFSGGVDLFRTFTPPTSYQIFSNQDLQVADSISSLTPKDSVFVTSHIHNHPIPALSGRATLLGFQGWVWSHGIDYFQREQDIKEIFLGSENTGNLIRMYKVNYVTIGPQERTDFVISEDYFQSFPSIKLNSDWTIYDVSNLWTDSNGEN